ncbi:uncharacterized protein ATNIH1004_009167 [Aspergillus tanneri]|nr:uncharacterized protein ATNIH1004_009167 [Aspergillus tanneri]KAA8644956.1 hypothetical protein ATNIH1004_009167 [Aspergillus tanneri]
MEPHPPGTPTNDVCEVAAIEEDPNTQPQRSRSISHEDAPNMQLQTTLSASHEMIIRPPIAPGFEDESFIAPLNRMANISHHRGANDILETWFRSPNAGLAVFYFFKARQYIKFRLEDPHSRPQITEFLLSIANDHFFADIHTGLLNWEDVIENINETNLLLVFTNLEHDPPVAKNFWAYVCSFDVKTGKRHSRDFDEDNDDSAQGRRKRTEKSPSGRTEESEY